MDIERLISERARGINGSGIREVFELGARMKDPINLSIGQPDFPVPAEVKRAAIDAIDRDRNGYSLTLGIPELRAAVERRLSEDLGWRPGSGPKLLITTGTSGAIALACLATLGVGDELIIPDPYFVMYPHMATLCGARAVICDTYPDFRMTAARVEPLIKPRTKAVLFNSPSNPGGVVATREECRDLVDLCRRRGILLISDEIYDEFTFSESRTDRGRCPSPARLPGGEDCVLLVRGFGKTYGVTGWRLGYAAGPAPIIDAMTRMQQYTFVCAPTPLQAGAAVAFDVDMAPHIAEYQRRRDAVVARLSRVTELATPGGAFYAFPRVPERLGMTARQFFETRCVKRELLVVPGRTFSTRDTHLRLSYATDQRTLDRGLDVLCELMR